MAVEEPPFKTTITDGQFEVREYPALTVAEVTVPGDQTQAAGRGFRLLAGYIFGGNTRKQHIAMTAPVGETPVGEKIAMTAPVSQTEQAGQWTVRFTMPSGQTLQTLPAPKDPQVHLRLAPPTRTAVVRFSGLANPRLVAKQTQALRAWMKTYRLAEAGPPTLAQYDPPWTLWFMRRNEVMIPIHG
jgi:hypothetical protein